MQIAEKVTISCDRLPLYQGEITLLPHNGTTHKGTGEIELWCGPAVRHLRVVFKPDDDKTTTLPNAPDNQYGRGTCFASTPFSIPFFLFVTSSQSDTTVIGEADIITGDEDCECGHLEAFLLNCLMPASNVNWSFGDWDAVLTRTECAYSLVRLSIPTQEINLTHKLVFARRDGAAFSWREARSALARFQDFIGFVNNSPISSPIIFGHKEQHRPFIRFQTPKTSVPTNRRTWATYVSESNLELAASHFQAKLEDEYWGNIICRAVDWLALADAACQQSSAQALSTVQMVLELLSYATLVEGEGVVSEAGYGKLPALDKINLLCSVSNQPAGIQSRYRTRTQEFCAANSIKNVGELISTIRNKTVHPTKKNREYVEQIPPEVYSSAITIGIQIASLAILKKIEYMGTFYDSFNELRVKAVPWVSR
jgi:hypothetical protein